VAAIFVILRHDVEQKGFDIVVERLRAEEELGEKAEILAVDGILTPVNFEERVLAVTVDLIAGGMLGRTFELVCQ
jgi:hypothetical protein